MAKRLDRLRDKYPRKGLITAPANNVYVGKILASHTPELGTTPGGQPYLKMQTAAKSLPNGMQIPAGTKTIVGQQAVDSRMEYQGNWNKGRTESVNKMQAAGFDMNNQKTPSLYTAQKNAGGAKVVGVTDAQRNAMNAQKNAAKAATQIQKAKAAGWDGKMPINDWIKKNGGLR